jgi:predicted transcriptional regulator
MPTLTFKVPIETAGLLKQIAARRGISRSAIIRKALDEELRRSTSLHELMKPSIGMIDSGVTDLGHHPRHLAGFGRR